MIVCVVCVIASMRLSTRRVTKTPPAIPRIMTTATDHRPAATTISKMRSRSSRSRPTSSRKPPGQHEHPRQRMMLGRSRLLDAAIGGFDPARLVKDAGRERADIAGEPLARSASSPDKGSIRAGASAARPRRQAGESRRVLYCSDSPPISASTVGHDLLGDQTARIERKINQQKSREQRKHQEVNQRQAKRRGAEKFTERCHEPCTPPRAPYAAAGAGNPCRSLSAGATCGRR